MKAEEVLERVAKAWFTTDAFASGDDSPEAEVKWFARAFSEELGITAEMVANVHSVGSDWPDAGVNMSVINASDALSTLLALGEIADE